MTQPPILPRHMTKLGRSETFTFSCHKNVKCFTECCRMLELALTPYDVLRLRRATGLTSRQLLDEYIIIEQDPGEPFPRFYLTMVDDGRASCVFVSEQGCTVYPHRPSACRAYPLGRAVVRCENGTKEEHFVLLKEAHCQGFAEPAAHNAVQYSAEQELVTYNRFNDAITTIVQHDSIRKGRKPSPEDIDLYILALYNIDTFREKVVADRLDTIKRNESEKNCLIQDDEKLLLFGIDWLHQQLFDRS
ncbi:YkgJ family cysteine cluster protein [Desulfopila sp. IMCC35006]|uniref:YkgJ family cysteine cluster protein n=1 Tax=Desulfopila sp. IMCC35006 TaxID=2569542 RepID=UPI00142EB38B|nr:YkgJ family cysteine cluster protein [Desulfopila sp. IMCC35006]